MRVSGGAWPPGPVGLSGWLWAGLLPAPLAVELVPAKSKTEPETTPGQAIQPIAYSRGA